MSNKRCCQATRGTLCRLATASAELAKDVAVIRGDFGRYLCELGYAALTIEQYQRKLVRVATWLRNHRHHSGLTALTRRMIPSLLVRALPRHDSETRMNYRKALFHWLRFQGRYTEPVTHPWGAWLCEYLEFLRTHQGVGRATLELNEFNAKAFMEWQFGRGRAHWSQVRPTDIWRFARQYVRGIKPISAKSGLGYVRRFLSFVHLRGACGPELAAAIPKVAVCGQAPRPEILSERQQRDLLGSIARTSAQGKRDYAMILCMLHLGLRGAEVTGLRLEDIDWRRRRLTIRITKTGRGRQLPLPKRVWAALRDYVKNARLHRDTVDHVFVRHSRRCGYPLTRAALKGIVHRAYHRCGFPPTWSGTHRLRHTFASRLHQRGLDLKAIADLLGHRRFDSTNLYTQVDIHALRPLAQPWPR